MCQLHLHVVSQDLLGSGMKKRQHYLSFATSFFLPLHEVRLRSAHMVLINVLAQLSTT
jgi:hypothetical protein